MDVAEARPAARRRTGREAARYMGVPARARCRDEDPALQALEDAEDHTVACHYAAAADVV